MGATIGGWHGRQADRQTDGRADRHAVSTKNAGSNVLANMWHDDEYVASCCYNIVVFAATALGLNYVHTYISVCIVVIVVGYLFANRCSALLFSDINESKKRPKSLLVRKDVILINDKAKMRLLWQPTD